MEGFVQCVDGFLFNQRRPFGDRVRDMFSGDDAIVRYCKTTPLLDDEPGFASFVGRGILIYLFEKAGSQRIENGERAADGSLRDIIQTALICAIREIAFLISVSPFLRDGATQRKGLTRGWQCAGWIESKKPLPRPCARHDGLYRPSGHWTSYSPPRQSDALPQP